MKRILLCLFIMGVCNISIAEETWAVGKVRVKGKPVIYKFLSQLPNEKVKHGFPWLAVVSWKYDGSSNNGMPLPDVNKSMISLEDELEKIQGDGLIYHSVYSATGNNLKEFVFYIADREKFMEKFNMALSQEPAYPIEINFYEDKEWSDLSRLISDFSGAKK